MIEVDEGGMGRGRNRVGCGCEGEDTRWVGQAGPCGTHPDPPVAPTGNLCA